MHNEHLSEGSLILKPTDVVIYLNIINKVINEMLELSKDVEVYPVCKYRIMQGSLISIRAGSLSTVQYI